MEIFATPDDMRAWSNERRERGLTIGVVPTMGALHAGHLALIDAARALADVVIVTIFVNPLQFNEDTDFDAYPRPIDDDVERCREHDVDAVYAPTAGAMYPDGFQTNVEPGALAERLEGPMRPGHFRGVLTVVAKLFGATAPHLAVFGQKDFQQLAIVRRMVADLDMEIEIIGLPTVRESDGLAMSSRNLLLGSDDRVSAVVISRALTAAAEAVEAGERSATAIKTLMTGIIEAEPRATLEYVEIVDTASLDDVERVEHDVVVLVAAWFGGVRLIDNRVVA